MILIADDDNAVRLSIGLALKHAGLESLAVGNEEETLQAVRDPKVSLLILDMNLTLSSTGRQGIEMLRKVRILRPDMPVILITAWGTVPMAVEAMSLGAGDYITKPWNNKDLIAKIRGALAGAEEARQEAERIDTLDDVERKAIIEAMRRCEGNVAKAAQQLGITRQSLYRRLEKFGL